jgi:3-hydroxybutyryl-CoA dehydrogenase
VGSLAQAVTGASAIVDATVDPERKRDIIREIVASGGGHLPVVSLSLTVSATEIASWHLEPGLVCGFGFLPPLQESRVIEVAPGLETADEARAAAHSFAAALGKTTIPVGDGAGLVAARIVSLIANEAAFALQEGIASADDIDAAVRLGANYPHGPLEWADLMGVDLVYAIIRGMYAELGDDRYRPAPSLRRMALAGRTGRGAGRGFFSYA